VADPTFYLFDGYNVLHAGPFSDPRELVDQLASFVAMKGARGVVVFDGAGEERTHGPLEVRYAHNADTMLERLAAELRSSERVCLVSSDLAVRGTSGQEVTKVSSAIFVRDLATPGHQEERPHRLAERLDRATRDRLERLRRNRSG
jgi:predicted RNA-binding protein with PIN domain